MTIRSRWFALQLAVVVLAVTAAPLIQAQRRGACGCNASMQLQMQMRYMPQLQAQIPRLPVPQYHVPALTPARVPVASRPYPQPVPHAYPVPSTATLHHLQTPAYQLRVPTAQARYALQTHTQHQLHTLQIPTLHLKYALHQRPSYAVTHSGSVGTHGTAGHGQLDSRLQLALRLVPSLQIHTLHKSSLFTTARLTANVTTGSRLVHIPSLSLTRRTLTPNRPAVQVHALERAVALPKPAVAQVPHKVNPVPEKPTPPHPLAKATASISMTCRNCTCGSTCTCCKGGSSKLNSRALVSTPAAPAPPVRHPALVPAPSAAPVVTRRPELTLPNRSPVSRQPFAPLVLLPAPLPLTPTALTVNPASFAALVTAPPLLTPAPGKALLPSPSPARTTSMLTDVLPASPSEAMPAIVADLNLLAPSPEQPGTSKLRSAATLVETQLPAVSDNPAAIPARSADDGPPLVLALLQPPPLPSGSLVTPREVIQTGLDDPPVLPALVDTLIQPPPLAPTSDE